MPDESLWTYIQRIFESKMWSTSKDISLYDLSPDGAAELNDLIQTVQHVFYFTYTTDATRAGVVLKEDQFPGLYMNRK